MHKKYALALLSLLITLSSANAAEGVWIPLFLKKLNESQMQSLGMKITTEDIYSVNRSSIKDAIVLFGGGCTGEVVSPDGLLFTNHHCGYSVIAEHSTIDNNRLQDGFWAKNRSEELINPSLSVTFIRRIEDVTASALKGVTDKMPDNIRQERIKSNLKAIKDTARREAWQNVEIKPFFKDNQYFMFIRETFNDVRLVGAPPVSIGKFGSETDNWVWPRHTGDFSVFRIYADKNNRPANPSADNIPYHPEHYLPISLGGVQENDFSMVYGFPGTTNGYLPGIALEQTALSRNPVKVGMRDIALSVWGREMRANDTIKLAYSNRFVSLANAWKKWQGESQGLIRTKAVDKKKIYEATFTQAIAKDKKLQSQYGTILASLYRVYEQMLPVGIAYDATGEFLAINDLARLTNILNKYKNAITADTLTAKGKESLKNQALKLLDSRTIAVDKKTFVPLMEFYVKSTPKEYLPDYVLQYVAHLKGDYDQMALALYSSPVFTKNGIEELFALTDAQDVTKRLASDGAFAIFFSISDKFSRVIQAEYRQHEAKIAALMKVYMKAQMEVFKDKTFFADANLTLRVSYGQVKGMEARDGLHYAHQTFLDGVMEKYIPGDFEFDLPAKLIKLYNDKDYGIYGENGRMPVCFIATNHTSGGNSGSPAINANGELVGLNFDRLWEGTMSDLSYDPSICRNIMVDVRYVLFLIDKLGGAGYLIDEMKIVQAAAKYPKDQLDTL